MKKSSHRIAGLAAAAGSIVLLAAMPQTTNAKQQVDPDWPCAARKVLEMSAGQIWDGPGLETAGKWQDDDAIRKLSTYLISRRVKLEDAEAAVKKYADGLPAADRDVKLTGLFAAVLARSNDDRKIVISGIERFNKRQIELAAKIEATDEGKEALKNAKSDAGGGESAGAPAMSTEAHVPAVPGEGATVMEDGGAGAITEETSEKYRWDIRIFQERQQNIPLACEIPGLIDERAGAIARAIRSQMKS